MSKKIIVCSFSQSVSQKPLLAPDIRIRTALRRRRRHIQTDTDTDRRADVTVRYSNIAVAHPLTTTELPPPTINGTLPLESRPSKNPNQGLRCFISLQSFTPLLQIRSHLIISSPTSGHGRGRGRWLRLTVVANYLLLLCFETRTGAVNVTTESPIHSISITVQQQQLLLLLQTTYSR